MREKSERWAVWSGVLAVGLWVIGIFVVESGDTPGGDATDADLLAYYDENANTILTGSWIFMVGCLAFLVFAVVLRERLLEAAPDSRLFTQVAWVGAVATGIFLMLTSGPDIAASISNDDISEAAAASAAMLGDAFFVAAELSAILLMLGVGAMALRGVIFPRAWGWFSFVLALILLIGPIGWAALIFGLPLWVLGTTWFLASRDPAGKATVPERT
jgi:hypothetical protein